MPDVVSAPYQQKEAGYFRHARKEVLPHLPESCSRILELGCGAGATLGYIHSKRPQAWMGGIEIAEKAALEAQSVCQQVWCGNIETMPPLDIPPASLDAILCLDVLEHLVEPWEMVKKLEVFLRPGGRLIVSLPNIRYYKVTIPLVFFGRFRYKKAGILDRTHLRFFVLETGKELVTTETLRVTNMQRLNRLKILRKDWIYNVLTLGLMRELFTEQFILVSEKQAKKNLYSGKKN